MNPQAPAAILMIRPAFFGYNPQTAASNAFQKSPTVDPSAIHKLALDEFNRVVDVLYAHDVEVKVLEDSPEVPKPDVVFPNNWISFQPDGSVIMYPMLAENRRLERRPDIIETLRGEFEVLNVIDLSAEEKNNKFLEGTGSLVFDHVNKIVFACRSPRTDEDLVKKLASTIKYKPVVFDAYDRHQKAIYHTNVMMCVGTKFAILCLDAITNEDDQETLLQMFSQTGHRVVAISFAQLEAFAGNMIEVQTHRGDLLVLLSETAFGSLLPGQVNAISEHAEMLPLRIDTIEKYGGGSVRCMIAGIHLPKRNSL